MTVLTNASVRRIFAPIMGYSGVAQVAQNSSAWPLLGAGWASGPMPAIPAAPIGSEFSISRGLVTGSPPAILIVHAAGGPVLFRLGYDKTVTAGPHLAGCQHLQPGQAILIDEGENVDATWIAFAAQGSAKVAYFLGSTSKQVSFDSSASDSFVPTESINQTGLANAATGFSTGTPVTVSGTLAPFGTLVPTGYPT